MRGNHVGDCFSSWGYAIVLCESRSLNQKARSLGHSVVSGMFPSSTHNVLWYHIYKTSTCGPFSDNWLSERQGNSVWVPQLQLESNIIKYNIISCKYDMTII